MILGLDISTSITGYTVLLNNGQIAEIGHWDTRNKNHFTDLFSKALYIKDKINIIDKYFLEEFNTNNSFFKIYYYGNPKKLSNELLEFGYHLRSDQGKWEIYKDE